VSSIPYDWRTPKNNNLWQGVFGTYNPCPSDFRLQTKTEWETEVASWSTNDAAGAFASPLKLVVSGERYHGNGNTFSAGSVGSYWSSTPTYEGAYSMEIYSSGAGWNTFYRATAYSVRCLKD
jgi:uncharacterized protein (TIGR02145 family)